MRHTSISNLLYCTLLSAELYLRLYPNLWFIIGSKMNPTNSCGMLMKLMKFPSCLGVMARPPKLMHNEPHRITASRTPRNANRWNARSRMMIVKRGVNVLGDDCCCCCCCCCCWCCCCWCCCCCCFFATSPSRCNVLPSSSCLIIGE